MKAVLLILTVILAILIATESVNYKFTGIECKDPDKKTFKTEVCKIDGQRCNVVTSLSRSLNTINVIMKRPQRILTASFPNPQVVLIFYKNEKSGFRQIFKVTRIEWCSLMDGSAKSNYMTKFVINTVKESGAEELFHECPFEGVFHIKNMTMKNDKLLSIFPNGNYRFDIKAADENNVEILFIRLFLELMN